MTDFTVDELKAEILRVHNETADDEGYDEYDDFYDWFNEGDYGYGLDVETKFGRVTYDRSSGRDPLYPSVDWTVFKVGDRYFGVEGYYDSWNGTTYEDVDLREVEEKITEVRHWAFK